MAIQATGRATFTAVEDYDIVFVLNGVRCNTLNFDSVRAAESAVLEADFFNGGAECVVDRAVLGCYDGEGALMGSTIEARDSSSAVADGGSLYLSKDCKTVSCEIYAGGKKVCSRSLAVVRNGSGVGVKAVSYKVLNNVAAGGALNWGSVQSQANYPTQKPDKGLYMYVMTIVLYTDGTTTNTVSTSYTPTDGKSVTITSKNITYAGGDSGVTPPTGGWQTSVPSLELGKYLWTKTRVEYSDGNSTESYSVGRIGKDGDKGATTHILYASSGSPKSKDDVRATMDETHQWYGTYQDTNLADDTSKYTEVKSWTLIKGEKGEDGTQYRVVEQYAYGTSNTAAPTSGWSDSISGGAAGQYLWNQETTQHKAATDTAWVQDSVTTHCVGYIAKNGENGANFTGVQEYYMATADEKNAPAIDSSWQATPTAAGWSAGKPYLWNYEIITRDKGGNITTQAHLDSVWGKKGDSAVAAKLRVDHSVCHFSRTSNSWDYDSVTVSIVIMDGDKTEIPAYGDMTKYFWRLSTDDTSTKRSSGMGFSASLTKSSITANLYKTGSDENVAIDTITVPMVFDGQNGEGQPATVYTIEPFGDIEASGTLKDGNTITVTVRGNVRAFKTTGDSKAEYWTQPQRWKMSVGDTDYCIQNNNSPFSNNAANSLISFSLSQDYGIDSVPGSANITLYKDNTLEEQLASLIVPISLNAGAIQDINNKLGTIQSTTLSLQGEITSIQQGQGQISLKVQGLGRDGVNMIYGGDVLGLADNKNYQVYKSNQVDLKANVTYTVSARMWMNASSSHNMLLVVYDDTREVLNASNNFSNTSAQVDGFSFTPKTDVKACVGIYEQDGKGGNPKSYVGVYIDWVRLEMGNLKDDDLNIDSMPTKWTPSLADIEANNLIPDPDFENSTWEMSDGGAMRELNNTQKTGTDFMSQYSGDQGTYGIYGLRMTRSGYSGTNIYDGMQYHIPFQGAGDYTLSAFFKNLRNVALDSEAIVEIHPCGADKSRTRGGTRFAINKSTPALGYVLKNVTRTFPEYETRSSDGKSVKTEWIEVRIFLAQNGDVVVSRLSLAKCSHAIHWNAAVLRSSNAAYSIADNMLATGIDIKSHKITLTADNVQVRNNSGETTTALDADGNLKAGSLTCQDKTTGVILKMMHGFFTALKGKAGVSLGLDENNYPCLIGTDPDGNVLWRLGQKYETADLDSKVTMEVASMKAYAQMNSWAIGEGVILTLKVTNGTNSAVTINTSNMHMILKSEFGNYRGTVDVATSIGVGETKQVVLRGTKATDTSSSSSTYTNPVGRSVSAAVVYQGDMRLMEDAEYQYQEGLRKDSNGNVSYSMPLM